MADHRLAVPARDVALFATAMAQALKIEGVTDDNSGRLAGHASWISALVRDLEVHRGKGLVVAGAIAAGRGPRAGARDQSIAGKSRRDGHAARPARPGPGRSGRLVARPGARHRSRCRRYAADPRVRTRPTTPRPTSISRPRSRATRSGCGFTSACTRTRPRSSATGTSRRRHFLETWSDIRAFDGTATIQQPLIAPLVPGAVRARGARGLPGRAEPARSGDRP